MFLVLAAEDLREVREKRRGAEESEGDVDEGDAAECSGEDAEAKEVEEEDGGEEPE